MIKIMMISGPALGHVARLSLVASELLTRSNVTVDFVVPDFSNHLAIVRDLKCDVHPIRIRDEDRKLPALAFAAAVENLYANLKPDLIVQDCSPQRWLAGMTFPECPRVVITNAFLTAKADLETHQKTEFLRRHGAFLDMRRKKNLPPLKTAYDLYDGTKVLLADPAPLSDLFAPWGQNIQNCGPLCLEDTTSLPNELANVSKMALFSMGSTGGLEAFSEIADKLRNSDDFDASVYVGSKASEARKSGCFDFCFDWLPLSSTLEKASVCITHGGTGSTYLALSKGVPVLMSPTHANHKLLADCLSRLGVGSHLGDGRFVEKVPHMRVELLGRITQFDHITAPQRHADAILECLEC